MENPKGRFRQKLGTQKDKELSLRESHYENKD